MISCCTDYPPQQLKPHLPRLNFPFVLDGRCANPNCVFPLVQNLLRLSLCDNLVTKKLNYRLYVIAKCPKLKHLDFRKVKPRVCVGGICHL